MATTFSRPWWTALAVTLAAGCAAAPLRNVTATFTISKDAQNCPKAVTMDAEKRNCRHLLIFTKEDCVRVVGKEQATIVFRGEDGMKPFAIYFQPFAPLRADGRTASFTVDAATPPKSYAFSVVAPGCKPIDPEVVVTEW